MGLLHFLKTPIQFYFKRTEFKIVTEYLIDNINNRRRKTWKK